MKSKYEKLIECIINEDHDKATEIFHKIVIEKSREIYESFNFEDDHNSFGGDKVDSFMHEVSCDEEGMNEEDDEFDDEADLGDTGDMGGDEGDFGDDMGGGMGDEFGGSDDDMGDEGSMEDRVVDLEDALDELKAEFDRLMAGDKESSGDMGGMGDDMGDEDMGGDDDHEDFGGGEDEHSFESKEFDSGSGSDSGMNESESGSGSGSGQDLDEDFAFMREYVEKVTLPANKNEGGEVGAKGSKVSVNTKGIVAGKNDMGGTTANIAKGGSEKAPDGTTPKSNAKKPSDLPNAGKYANVPGADAGKTWNKKAKATGDTKETGKETGNGKSVKINKDSEINGKGLNGNKSGKK